MAGKVLFIQIHRRYREYPSIARSGRRQARARYSRCSSRSGCRARLPARGRAIEVVETIPVLLDLYYLLCKLDLNPGIIDTDMLRSCFGDQAGGYLGLDAHAHFPGLQRSRRDVRQPTNGVLIELEVARGRRRRRRSVLVACASCGASSCGAGWWAVADSSFLSATPETCR